MSTVSYSADDSLPSVCFQVTCHKPETGIAENHVRSVWERWAAGVGHVRPKPPKRRRDGLAASTHTPDLLA